MTLNAHETDPPDLPSGQQPSDWATQRSDIRSISIQFSEDVEVTPDDLRLTNLGVNAPLDADTVIPLFGNHISVHNGFLTLSFAPNELPAGVYQLYVLGTVVDSVGNPLDGDGDGVGGDAFQHLGDQVNRFYKIPGDFNGDLGVSIRDFPTFAYWFGQRTQPNGTAPGYVDMNSDNGISIFDFPVFAENFGSSITFVGEGVVHGLMQHDVSDEHAKARSVNNPGEAARRPATDKPFRHGAVDIALRELLIEWPENDRRRAPMSMRAPVPVSRPSFLEDATADELLGQDRLWDLLSRSR